MKGKNPELAQLMERMRYELARELGLDAVQTGDFGSVSSKACGTYGRLLQRRAAQLANGVGAVHDDAGYGNAGHGETGYGAATEDRSPVGNGGATTKSRPGGTKKHKEPSTPPKRRTR